MKRITWGEKMDIILIYPSLNLKQIQALLSVGQPAAMEVREKALKLAETEGRWISGRKAPTDLVLKTVGLNLDYFRNMAMNESVVRTNRKKES